jgi:hypothetical protein
MSGIETLMSIIRVEGEVMLHDGRSGWVRAHAGMVFPAGAEITIKTGRTGYAEIINARGELVHLPQNSMKLITADFSADDVDTLRHLRLTAYDMLSARSLIHQSVAPAV